MPWKRSEPMEQRTEFALKALKSENFRALCQEYGISTKTGYKWREGFLSRGIAGLAEESRRPRSSPQQLKEEEVCQIVRLKFAHPYWGPRKIRELYLRQHGEVASLSSFKRVLEAAGITQRRKRRRATEAGRLSSGAKAKAVNEIWTVDFKGWWHGTEGRCEPLTVRDEFSRYLLELRQVPNARSHTVQASFEKLFQRHGLPQAIRSDNGTPFASRSAVLGLSRLSAWWVALGINLERSRPGKPQDNGAHERLHRDISQELDYEGMTARRVNHNGCIRWKDRSLFVSQSLSGWNVGLKSTQNQKIELWFAQLLLGHLDPATISFERIDLNPIDAKTNFKNAA